MPSDFLDSLAKEDKAPAAAARASFLDDLVAEDAKPRVPAYEPKIDWAQPYAAFTPEAQRLAGNTGEDVQPVVGAGEAALQTGTSLLSSAVGGAAGLGNAIWNVSPLGLIAHKLGMPESNSADIIEAAQQAGTYQPRTFAGQVASQAVSDAFDPDVGTSWLNPLAIPGNTGKALGGFASEHGAPAWVSTGLEMAPQVLIPEAARRVAISPVASKPLGPATAAPQTFGPDSASAAAASPDISKVSPGLRQEIMREHAAGTLDREAAMRKIDADTLPIPIQLTEGEARNSADMVSRERNDRGKSKERTDFYQRRNQQLIDNLGEIRREAAPNVVGRDTLQHGQQMIESWKQYDAPVVADIDAKYQALRDAAGGEWPVDAKQVQAGVARDLKKELLANDLPKSLAAPLEEFAQTGTMTFQDWLTLRRNAGTIARTNSDGLVRQAAGIVVENLEKLPMSGEAANLKPLADAARSAAKDRFDKLKANPGYKAAVEDGVEAGELSPLADSFAKKYVINGKAAHLKSMRELLAGDEIANETISAIALDHLDEKSGAQKGTFTQNGYNNAWRDLSPRSNYLFPAKTSELAEQLGRVANTVVAPPAGHYVSTSNTATALIAEGAKSAAEGAVNVAAKGIPVGTFIRGKLEKRAAQKEWEKATAPSAGLKRLSDIAKLKEPR